MNINEELNELKQNIEKVYNPKFIEIQDSLIPFTDLKQISKASMTTRVFGEEKIIYEIHVLTTSSNYMLKCCFDKEAERDAEYNRIKGKLNLI